MFDSNASVHMARMIDSNAATTATNIWTNVMQIKYTSVTQHESAAILSFAMPLTITYLMLFGLATSTLH